MQIARDLKSFIDGFKVQDFGFYMATLYLTFEYFRPHAIYPSLDIIPWTKISILLGLFYVLIKGNIRIQITHFFLILFLIVAYISCFLSYDRDSSLKMINVLVSWVVVVIFFSNSVKNLFQYKLLIIILFIFFFKLSLFGAKTWALRGFSFTGWGIAGPSGFFQNSGELSLLMVIFFALSYGFISGHKNASKLYYLAPITAAMTVLAASSRGSQLALAAVVVLLLIRIGKLRLKTIAIILFIAWTGITLLPDEQKTRFSTMGDDGTSESRLVYWKKGREMMEDYPWFGVGYYAFTSYFSDNYAPFIEFENFSYRKEVAHNSYIQVGSEMGFTGLSIYLVLLFLCFRLNNKTKLLAYSNKDNKTLSWIPRYCIGSNMALLGYLIGSTFMSVAFYPYIYLFLMLNQSLYNVTKRSVYGV